MSTNYDYFDNGSDLPEQQLDLIGLRRVQHFNESPYHRGTSIHLGGYGIKNDNGNAPAIGKTETIKHRGGNQTDMVVAKQIEIALIGFTPTYRTLEGTDSEGKYRSVVVPEWMKNLPAGMRIRSGISYFIVLKADPAQELYELTFKGFVVNEAKQIVANVLGACKKLGDAFTKERGKLTKVQPFAFWLPLGVGESRMVGQAEQSPVTPPALKIETLTFQHLEERFVTKDEYLHFIELRKQVDEYLATGRYQGQYDEHGQPALPPGMALTAGNGNGNGKALPSPEDEF